MARQRGPTHVTWLPAHEARQFGPLRGTGRTAHLAACLCLTDSTDGRLHIGLWRDALLSATLNDAHQALQRLDMSGPLLLLGFS